jgi:TatD DNase family protein
MYQDRGGSREGKKSLRSNKKAIVEAAKKDKHVPAADRPSRSLAPPTLKASTITSPPVLVDCGANLTSRKFDRDLEAVLRRSRSANVRLTVNFTTDFEKTESMMSICKTNSGELYCATGLHPDNVKRNNDKQFATWLEKLKDFALTSECVALMCGLDFSREVGTHYAQEKCVEAQVKMAQEIGLPLIVFESGDGGAFEKMCELIGDAESREEQNVAVFYFNRGQAQLDTLLSMGLYIGVSGSITDPKQQQSSSGLYALLPSIPKDRVLLFSNSPNDTPQNIEDAFIRDSKNEPSNLNYVVSVIAERWGESVERTCEILHDNALEFFGLSYIAAPSASPSEEVAELPKEGEKVAVAKDEHKTTDEKKEKAPQQDRKEKKDKQPSGKDKKDKASAAAGAADGSGDGSSARDHKKKKGKGRKGRAVSESEESEEERAPEQHSTEEDEEVEVPQSRSKKAVHFGGGAAEEKRERDESLYACKRCRRVLFAEADAESKDEQFLNFDLFDEAELEELHLALDLDEEKVSCAHCSAKLGRLTNEGLKIARSRVEVFVEGLTADDASMLAAAAQLQLQLDDKSDDSDDDRSRKDKKKKNKKAKQVRRSNLSSFRNKDFNVAKLSSKEKEALALQEREAAAAAAARGSGSEGSDVEQTE